MLVTMLKNLGHRIRTLRKQKGLTLIDMAAKTGIAQATLSRIETGTMTGTVDSHEKIAEVLGIGLAELYERIDKRYDEIAHLKKENERQVTFHSRLVNTELLTSLISQKKITPLLMTLQSEGQSEEEKLERGVEKFVFVLEGEINAHIENQSIPLKKEETLYFDASLPHAFSNSKAKPARLLIAASPAKI